MNNDIVSGFDDRTEDSVTLKLQKIDGIEGGLIVYTSGHIDTYSSILFRRRIERAIEAGFLRLILEMSQVSYVSSTGWGTLAHLGRLVKPQNGELVLNRPQPKVIEVAKLLGLAQHFNVRDSLDESLDFFLFPKVFSCPACGKHLSASKAGRFRCSECKTVIEIDAAASVKLG